jgi:hypothetical protein
VGKEAVTGWECLPTTGSAAKPAARRAPEFGPSAAPALYVLQRTAGNRAVTRLLQRAADNCAVARALANPQVQRQPTLYYAKTHYQCGDLVFRCVPAIMA